MSFNISRWPICKASEWEFTSQMWAVFRWIPPIEPVNRHAYSCLTSATCPHASRWDVEWFAGMCTAVQISAWKWAGILAQFIKDLQQTEKNQVAAEFGKIKMKHLGIISACHFSFENSFNFCSYPDFWDIPSCTPTLLTVGCRLLSDTDKPKLNVNPKPLKHTTLTAKQEHLSW